jgi:uncharacterized spore protein YtfJ
MKLPDLLDTVSGDVDATRIFGEPIQIEGATVIPVARVRGGATAGRAEGMLGRGGFKATPVGVFVIRDGEVTWTAAVDENRVALIGVITGLAAAVIATLAMLRRPPWPDIHMTKTK